MGYCIVILNPESGIWNLVHLHDFGTKSMSDMKIYDLDHTDLTSLVYKRVKNLIVTKVLPAGQKIVQDELSRQLGVSRTPLIKALQRLEAEFLVESIPRRGIFVKDISAEELIDAFECREALESVSARRAATRITDAQITQLRAIFIPLQNQEGQFDSVQYVDADMQFHKLIGEISGNRIIARLEILGNLERITQLRINRLPEETLEEHLAIIEALAMRDPDEAERLMHAHLRRTRDSVARDAESRAPHGEETAQVSLESAVKQ